MAAVAQNLANLSGLGLDFSDTSICFHLRGDFKCGKGLATKPGPCSGGHAMVQCIIPWRSWKPESRCCSAFSSSMLAADPVL